MACKTAESADEASLYVSLCAAPLLSQSVFGWKDDIMAVVNYLVRLPSLWLARPLAQVIMFCDLLGCDI